MYTEVNFLAVNRVTRFTAHAQFHSECCMRQEIGKIEFLAEKRIFSENVWLDVLFLSNIYGKKD